MELEPVVETALGKFDEVANMDGSILACQLHADGALRGRQDGDFVACRLVGRSVKISHDVSPLFAFHAHT